MDKGKYLDSWKEISAYLGRNIRTCRNWEHDLGLPVHRLDGALKAHVFAYTGEIDAWREEKGRLPEEGKTGTGDMEAPDLASAQDPAVTRRPARIWLIIGLIAAPLLAVIATAFVTRQLRPISKPAVGRFTIKLESGHWLEGGREAMELERPSRTAMAISRNGRFVVYSAIEGNPGTGARPRLFLRRMDQKEATPITGTEGGIDPFLSPDNRWVGFWADGKLKKIPIEGGIATELCDSTNICGANWGRDDRIVFVPRIGTGISRVSAAGGKPETLTVPDPEREEYSHLLPYWLPNGKAVLFTVMRHLVDAQPWVVLLRLDTHERRVLLENAADARYVPTGHVVFLRQGTLMAVRFDMETMEAVGQPVAIEKDIMQSLSISEWTHTGAGQFAISDAGSLIYAFGAMIPPLKNSLLWLDHTGTEHIVTDLRFPFFAPRLSPDGLRIAYDVYQQNGRIWVYDLGRGTNTQMTNEGQGEYPIWSPDGKRILFGIRKSLANLYMRTCDGSSPAERVTQCDMDQMAGSWSSDGNTVAILEWTLDNKSAGIAMLDVRSGRVTPFLNSDSHERYPEFSPDGRWLAYTSNESYRDEVYVRSFPGPGIKQIISNEGGVQPLWSRDGKRLYYRRQDQMWVVDVRADGGFVCSKPRLLFKRPGFHISSPIRNYDLSRDGQRFLMVKLEQREPEPVTEMIIVENWLQELKRLVPLAKKAGR
jgi:eukaryotic-like serine/threonine-protein kinase